jgi:hypothetical protein
LQFSSLGPITGATGEFYSHQSIDNFFSRLPILFHDSWRTGFAAAARSLHASEIVTRPVRAFFHYSVEDSGQIKTPIILPTS